MHPVAMPQRPARSPVRSYVESVDAKEGVVDRGVAEAVADLVMCVDHTAAMRGVECAAATQGKRPWSKTA